MARGLVGAVEEEEAGVEEEDFSKRRGRWIWICDLTD
jgi:hypothetical protein